MASFKKHCSFGFWKATLMKQNKQFIEIIGRTAMGHLGRIESIFDLPSKKILTACIKEAMLLNEMRIKVQKKIIPAKNKTIKIPAYLLLALNKNKKAKGIFEKGSYSFQNEYVEWITEAKTEDTRNKRMKTAIEWIAEGKGRNWKYEKK